MDELLAGRIPYSMEAEQAVLGSVLIDARCVAEVIGALRPDDFYSSTNREIFEAIFSMFNNSLVIDPVTVLKQMREDGVWTEASHDYVLELMDITPTAANVMEYAAIVKDMSLLRLVADTGSEIARLALEGMGGAAAVLEAAEKKIYALRHSRSRRGLERISTILVDVYEQISRASQSDAKIPGLPTGLYELDNKIMGLNKSDLILIAARPGMGKTSLALNFAMNVAKESSGAVAVFSLEMSCEQLALRLLSSDSHIDSKKLQTGRISGDEWPKLAKSAADIGELNLLINDDPSLSVADMNSQCRRVDNLGLVVIDYLQLMQSASSSRSYYGENRQTIVADISRMLKIMAKELNVPVICCSQLSRASEKREKNKRPLLSDLRESGAIEQDADIVIGLYREDYYDREGDSNNEAECIILKNRRGELGTVLLQWLPQYTSFSSKEWRRTDEDY